MNIESKIKLDLNTVIPYKIGIDEDSPVWQSDSNVKKTLTGFNPKIEINRQMIGKKFKDDRVSEYFESLCKKTDIKKRFELDLKERVSAFINLAFIEGGEKGFRNALTNSFRRAYYSLAREKRVSEKRALQKKSRLFAIDTGQLFLSIKGFAGGIKK